MNELRYKALNSSLNENLKLKKFIVLSDRILTLFIMSSYIIAIVLLEFLKSDKILLFVCVPLVSFILTSIFRAVYDEKRPYEKMDIIPLTKTGINKGKSFPSRHVFSAFIISFAFFYVNWIIGLVYLIFSLLLSVTRILTGEHFLKDIIAGIGFAVFFGIIGFLLISF